jgi:HEAT repeat protein
MAGVSFDDLVRNLADPAQPLAVSKLTVLSNMAPGQTALFTDAWLAMDLRRRRRLIQELIDLVEDNVELNFDRVFITALADMDAGVRRDAIKGLWEHDGRDLAGQLIGLLQRDPDAGVRAEAALALGRFVIQAEFETLPADDIDRVEAALRRAVNNAAEAVEVRGRALEAIGARSEPWVRLLIDEAFAGTDRILRLSAVHAMGRSCDPAWLPALIQELRSDEAAIRFEAAVACGSIADEAATPYLLPLLNDEDAEVQQAAIDALGEIGGDAAREALEGLVERGDERLREAALAALADVEFAQDPLGIRYRE